MNYYENIRNKFSAVLNGTESEPFLHAFNNGWNRSWLENNEHNMTPDEVWEYEQNLYQQSNYGQYCHNSYVTLEGSPNMDGDDIRRWEERNTQLKTEWFDFVFMEVDKGEEVGKKAYQEALAASRRDNKFQALRRIARSGSLKSAKAKFELNSKFPLWNEL